MTGDSTLQLFTAEEVLNRLTEQARTGALHVFTLKEAANVFFREGMIVGAAKGLVEGEEVLKQILEWKDVTFHWQEGQPSTTAKSLDLQFPEFITRFKMMPKLEIGGKILSEGKPDTRMIAGSPLAATGAMRKPSPLSSTSAMKKPTGSLPPPQEAVPVEAPRPLRPLEVTRQDVTSVSSGLSATKSMNPTPLGGDPFEEALLRRHQLALVSCDEDGPTQRLRIVRCNNLVGRNPACDFTMNHSSVSRQHCLMQITERGLHVKDLSTTNGTKVNGIPLTEGYINIGDKLTIGDLSFMLEKDEPVVDEAV